HFALFFARPSPRQTRCQFHAAFARLNLHSSIEALEAHRSEAQSRQTTSPRTERDLEEQSLAATLVPLQGWAVPACIPVLGVASFALGCRPGSSTPPPSPALCLTRT